MGPWEDPLLASPQPMLSNPAVARGVIIIKGATSANRAIDSPGVLRGVAECQSPRRRGLGFTSCLSLVDRDAPCSAPQHLTRPPGPGLLIPPTRAQVIVGRYLCVPVVQPGSRYAPCYGYYQTTGYAKGAKMRVLTQQTGSSIMTLSLRKSCLPPGFITTTSRPRWEIRFILPAAKSDCDSRQY